MYNTLYDSKFHLSTTDKTIYLTVYMQLTRILYSLTFHKTPDFKTHLKSIYIVIV